MDNACFGQWWPLYIQPSEDEVAEF